MDVIEHRGHKLPFAFPISFCRISVILAIRSILPAKQLLTYQTRMYTLQPVSCRARNDRSKLYAIDLNCSPHYLSYKQVKRVN